MMRQPQWKTWETWGSTRAPGEIPPMQYIGKTPLQLYYDRNPVSIFKGNTFTPGAALLAQTQGFLYTVPKNRVAFLEGASGTVRNNSATALNGEASARISVAPAAVDLTVSSNFVDVVRALIEVGQASVSNSIALAGFAMLQAGESCASWVNSGNNAVSSNVLIDVYAKLTEFDAFQQEQP